jgi:glycosyltransferase involved in cell wall biosynthesis
MTLAWSRVALRRGQACPHVVIVGTDPVMSVVVAPFLKLFRRSIVVAHWCFDMYPEAAVAADMLRPGTPLLRLMQKLVRRGYRACDLIADIGPRMQRRLREYGSSAKAITITPWALWEPESVPPVNQDIRQDLFGDCRLGLLYSGSFGRAHAFRGFLELAERLSRAGVSLTFAVRGNRVDELRAAISAADANVRLAAFASEGEFGDRLAAADVHMVSLRREWSGIVVPSKFFAALAAGRPVLYDGPRNSAIAQWIRRHDIGWVVDEQSLPGVADALQLLARDSRRLRALQRHCHAIYHRYFSLNTMVECWDHELRRLVS